MNEQLSSFFIEQPEPNKSCFLALRDILLSHDLEETIKYGMPCYTYKGKPLCYLWKDKKSLVPYILFVDGALLYHPSLHQGTRAKMKILPVDPEKDLELVVIQSLLSESIKLRI
jgi:uncharacterized protein YdeI (YjbR/CyaY-like superfamily)